MRLYLLLFLILSVSCDKNSRRTEPLDAARDEDQAVIGSGHVPTTPGQPNSGPSEQPVETPSPESSPELVIELDARSNTEYVYFKWESGTLTRTASDQAWILAVKRTQFMTNSGTSGPLGFGVMNKNTTEFESVKECSDVVLTADEILPASGAPGSQPTSGNSLLSSWFDYDMTTHVVTSKKHVYLISDGRTCLKFQIVSYNAGLYQVRAQLLARPEPAPMPIPEPTPEPSPEPTPEPTPTPEVPEQTIDASSTMNFVHLAWDDEKLVSVGSDQSWILAVKRTQFQTNSGTSGSGNFGVLDTGTTDYESVVQCQTGTLTYDEMLPASGAPGSQPFSGNALLNAWYNYDPSTHAVSSKKLVYVMTDGARCLKFQILSYASGVYKVRAAALDIPAPEPADVQQTLDASSSTASLYLSWSDSEEQLVSTTVDQPWLFAVKRTQFQTNSGTSGSRGVGVHNTASTDFAAVTSCSGLAFTYDEMLPASGAPGSQPYSGNAVLNTWYDYDMTTHTVQSKKLVYLLFDGNECVKLQILSYTSGVYTVRASRVVL